jgi:hypothetical protein
MDAQRLARLVEQPEIHRRLLGSYSGAYSLGVTADPDRPERPAVRIRIQGDEAPPIPSELLVEGESVNVIVTPRFTPPTPLPLRVNAR